MWRFWHSWLTRSLAVAYLTMVVLSLLEWRLTGNPPLWPVIVASGLIFVLGLLLGSLAAPRPHPGEWTRWIEAHEHGEDQ